MPNLANSDYVLRINRAIDLVTARLGEPLPLEEVARAAAFSPFHFHRVFKSMMGETLASFVKRARLERAVSLMSHRPGAKLTDIALACGFASSSDFSRSFRGHFGVPPSVFDVKRFRESHRARLEELSSSRGYRLLRLPPGENPDGFEAKIRALPARRVAYIRVQNPYAGPGVMEAIARLTEWAEAHGLADGQWLGYQWDDPEIVPLDQCRYDTGLEIPARSSAGEGISMTDFAPMTVAELELDGGIDLELRALDWIFKTWLPSSGFAPAPAPIFEAWNGRPFATGTERFSLRLQLPVVDARAPV